MINILEFGHLPYWAGGRQSSGGANAMFQIAYHLSKKGDVSVSFGATDIFEERRQCGEMIIYGWTKWILLKYCLTHLLSTIKCLRYTISWRRHFPDTISFGRRLTKCIFHIYLAQRLKPELIHLHNDPEFYTDLLCEYAKIVVTVHGIFGNDENVENHEYYFQYEGYNAKNNNISLMTFVTNSIQREYEQLYGVIIPTNVVVLNAYDSARFYYQEKRPSDTLTLSTIASISERKGQIRVVNGIIKSGVKCKYLCVGNGSEKEIESIKTLAGENNVDFHYLGEKTPDEIREILVHSDYMILPSSSEGFGLVFLEAIACGTPVVLPKDLPIVKEKGIINDSNAVLLDDSSGDAIAKALREMTTMKYDRSLVSRTVSNYSWDSITDDYLREMKRVL